MFDIDDISVGHQDIFTAKYSLYVNDCRPVSNMDLYLGSSTFQDMLDIDMKSEMDNVFGNHDLSFSFADMSDVDDNTLSNGNGILNDPNIWFSGNSNHSSSNLFELRNEGASRMVDPNSVMPANASCRVLTPTLTSSVNPDVDTPSPKRSHLTFSPSIIDINIKQENVSAVKKDLTEQLERSSTTSPQLISIASTDHKIKLEPDTKTSILVQNKLNSLPKPIHILTTKTVTTKSGAGGGGHSHSLLTANNIKLSTTNSNTKLITSASHHIDNLTSHQKHHVIHSLNNRKKKYPDEEKNPFPKPTYSYSCLIAMALKNSRTGSLPVSEIYNFMCEHFPYFKTAPNGWKNSVRHNLSLNKCFEKIEKPAVTGSQRKGCLWAMHPDKINKMDEEVQKWSRKDPAAIRRAMVYPEHLEALERGELKYGSESYGDSSGSGASDSEVDTENEEIEVDNNVTIREDVISQSDQIDMNSLGDSYDEASLTDYDNETGETLYETSGADIETDDETTLRMEFALAQQELFNYQQNNGGPTLKAISHKRIRLSNVSANVDLMYQPIHTTSTAGRRKTPLIVRNHLLN